MNDRYIFEITETGELIITLLNAESVERVVRARGPCGPVMEMAEGNRLARLRFSSLRCLGDWIERFGGSIEFARKM